MFVHLIDASGRPVILSDAQPLGGAFPTSVWVEGDMLTEERRFTLPTDHAAGPSQLEVGWYRPATLERLPAVGEGVSGDAVILPGPVLP